MKLIEPNVEIWKPKSYSIKGGLRHAERCARTCYASNDRQTDTSYEKFMNNIIKIGHLSVCEHMTIYLTIPIGSPIYDSYYLHKHELMEFFSRNPYSVVIKSNDYNTADETPEEYKSFVSHCGPARIYYITTNYRVILENKDKLKWSSHSLDETILPYVTEPTKHERRTTVHWTISRGIADEFARHRVLSHSMQSTRYCNYTKDKFGNELTFIQPTCGINATIETAFSSAEVYYNQLIELGFKPQQARDVLPLGLKTELIQTGTTTQWEAFFKLRCDKSAHPDAQYIANKLKELLENENNKN